jgi:hypothetical protein
MNDCRCPDPPGGRALCDDDQLAICRVMKGGVETFCISPPSGDVAALKVLLTYLQRVRGGNFEAHWKDWDGRFESSRDSKATRDLDANFVL